MRLVDSSVAASGLKGRPSTRGPCGLKERLGSTASAWRDAWSNDQVEALAVTGRVFLEEEQCALHAARLVPMDTARDQHARLDLGPLATADSVERVAL